MKEKMDYEKLLAEVIDDPIMGYIIQAIEYMLDNLLTQIHERGPLTVEKFERLMKAELEISQEWCQDHLEPEKLYSDMIGFIVLQQGIMAHLFKEEDV